MIICEILPTFLNKTCLIRYVVFLWVEVKLIRRIQTLVSEDKRINKEKGKAGSR